MNICGLSGLRQLICLAEIASERPFAADVFAGGKRCQHQFTMIGNFHGFSHNMDVGILDQVFAIGISSVAPNALAAQSTLA